MANIDTRRTALGLHFSEAARLLWSEVDRRRKENPKFSLNALGRALGFVPGVITRDIYGDRLPQATRRIVYAKKLGIPVEAWDRKPSRRFALPGMRTARAA
jgi:hypothetical protein